MDYKNFFNDKHGERVIWQAPNLPFLVFLVCQLLSIVVDGRLQILLESLAFGAIFVFAWLELFDGASPFRRTLGLLIIVFLLLTRL